MFAKSIAKCLLVAGISVNSLSAAQESSDAASSSLSAKPEKKLPTREELLSPAYLTKLSETYGHMIMKSLNNPSVNLSVKDVIQGIQNASEGKPSPMTEKECEEAFRLIQQYAEAEILAATLRETEDFLQENSKFQDVIEIIPGKIQYKVLQIGAGESVTEEMTPTVHYSASYQGGMSLGSSDQHGGPIEIDLVDAIPGFRQGVLGMKIGEKRRIFIHPDFGYQAAGPVPNGLLIFDIEVVKVAPRALQAASEADEEGGYISDEDDLVDSDDNEDYRLPMLDNTAFEDDESEEEFTTDSSESDYIEYENS